MSNIKRVLALLIGCTLLIAAAPYAGAATVSDFTGTWKGANEYYTMTITFYDDYTYDTAIDQNGQLYQVTGTYSFDNSYFYFLPYGSQLSVLGYFLSGDLLTLYDAQSGETIYLDRQGAEAAIPEGLAGTWTGLDDGETLFLTLTGNGEIVIAYGQPDAVEATGRYTAQDGVIDADFADDTYLSLRFMLAGDTLIFADGERMLTLTRYTAPAPTARPQTQPTAAPAVPASPELVGTWLGADGVGTRKLVLTAEGGVTLSYEGDAAPAREGLYTADGSALTATFADGTTEVFRYLLMGDTLLLTDDQLGGAVTMTRQTGAPAPDAPTPAPALDPALFGTWGGMDDGVYVEATYSRAGKLVTFIPSDPESGGTGTYTASDGKVVTRIGGSENEMDYAIQGDVLTFGVGDRSVEFVKKPGPLSRAALPEQADAPLVGAWGGMEGDVYREIAFFADGTYEKFAPQDEAKNEKGNYMAQGGSLAVLLAQGALQGTYELAEGALTIVWAGGEPLTLTRMPGPLTRTLQAE